MNEKSLQSLVSFIGSFNSINNAHIHKVTALLESAIIGGYWNVVESLLNLKSKFDIEQLIPQIEHVCSFTKEMIENNDKENTFLSIMNNLLQVIVRDADYKSERQQSILRKVFGALSFSYETSGIKIPESGIKFIEEVILKSDAINSNIVASLAKQELSYVPLSDESTDFIFEVSGKELDAFVMRQIVASIGYQLKCQQLYCIDPTHADKLFDAIKRNYMKNPELMIPFIAQIVDSSAAKKALANSTLWFNLNQDRASCVLVRCGGLKFPSGG